MWPRAIFSGGNGWIGPAQAVYCPSTCRRSSRATEQPLSRLRLCRTPEIHLMVAYVDGPVFVRASLCIGPYRLNEIKLNDKATQANLSGWPQAFVRLGFAGVTFPQTRSRVGTVEGSVPEQLAISVHIYTGMCSLWARSDMLLVNVNGQILELNEFAIERTWGPEPEQLPIHTFASYAQLKVNSWVTRKPLVLVPQHVRTSVPTRVPASEVFPAEEVKFLGPPLDTIYFVVNQWEGVNVQATIDYLEGRITAEQKPMENVRSKLFVRMGHNMIGVVMATKEDESGEDKVGNAVTSTVGSLTLKMGKVAIDTVDWAAAVEKGGEYIDAVCVQFFLYIEWPGCTPREYKVKVPHRGSWNGARVPYEVVIKEYVSLTVAKAVSYYVRTIVQKELPTYNPGSKGHWWQFCPSMKDIYLLGIENVSVNEDGYVWQPILGVRHGETTV
ncbi:hypothetical protein BDW22DRAFT_338488 [Trametopsis cervina]|nr:hypothetical protein BDW22DRAFT_338488 [Trametopsis cervina]